MKQFATLDEAHAISDDVQCLAPQLFDSLNAAYADVIDRYPADLFWENQNRTNIPRLVNQRCAKIWNGNSWILEDKSGYLHLREKTSGLRAILRRVDPITGGLPKTNSTKASHAYYMQSTCKGEGELAIAEQDGLFTPEDRFAPDLSDTRLILAWQDIDRNITITAYRPLKTVRFGDVEQKYDFKLELRDDVDAKVKDFIPIDDDINLLPILIADDVDVVSNVDKALMYDAEHQQSVKYL